MHEESSDTVTTHDHGGVLAPGHQHGHDDDHNQPAPVGSPELVGRWDLIKTRFNYLPIHIALLRTGKVLAFGGSGNQPERLKKPFPSEIFDPITETVTAIGQTLAGDIFCAGHAFLADGRLLVAGGTENYDWEFDNGTGTKPFAGLDQAYTFDPVSERWQRVPDMSEGRWYPTLVQMGDDSVLAMAGLTKGFPWLFLRKIERFVAGAWRDELKAADKWMPLYPRLHLLPDGSVFYAGSYNTHYTFPFNLSAFPPSLLEPGTMQWRDIAKPRECEREEGSSLLLPFEPPYDRAAVLLIGGGKPGGETATNSVERIEFSIGSAPHWQFVGSMKHERYFSYATLLPDGEIFLFGGKKGKEHMSHGSSPHHLPGQLPDHDMDAIMECEMFGADSAWRCVAPMQVDRLYHSGALLLPDGRVLAAGSNPMRGCNETRIEIFSPPYLFKGARPVITACAETVKYGGEIELCCESQTAIDTMVLVRPISTTHCLGTEQRLIKLSYKQTGEVLRGSIPTNRSLLPPGYYMIFVLSNGVPSVARFVCVS